ncbi:hypothetical protein TCAL_05129, partial [Tigriopus californicus]
MATLGKRGEGRGARSHSPGLKKKHPSQHGAGNWNNNNNDNHLPEKNNNHVPITKPVGNPAGMESGAPIHKANIVMNLLNRFSKFTSGHQGSPQTSWGAAKQAPAPSANLKPSPRNVPSSASSTSCSLSSSTTTSTSTTSTTTNNNNGSHSGLSGTDGLGGNPIKAPRHGQAQKAKDAKQRAKLDHELSRLHTKIETLLGKLDDVTPQAAASPEEECVLCRLNRATMQTFPCGHQVVCRTCFVRTIQATVAQKKLPLRCIWCSAKILKLQQNQEPKFARQQKLTISSSNFSFASGVSNVSSASSSNSLRSQKSFNFDTLSNFQNAKLMNGIPISRTRSANSFRARRTRSPSPGRVSLPSGSVQPRSHSSDPKGSRTPVNRTSSEDSLSSQMSFPASSITSISPRSPTSPSWSTGSLRSCEGILNGGTHPYYGTSVLAGSFFPAAVLASSAPNSNLVQGVHGPSGSSESSVSSSSCCSSTRSSRLGTPLSPIKESRQESSGSPLENASPEKRPCRYRVPPKAEMDIDDFEQDPNDLFVEDGQPQFECKAAQEILTPKRSSRIVAKKSRLFTDHKNANLRPIANHPSCTSGRLCRPPSWEEDLDLICPIQSSQSNHDRNNNNNNNNINNTTSSSNINNNARTDGPLPIGSTPRMQPRTRRTKSVTFSDDC